MILLSLNNFVEKSRTLDIRGNRNTELLLDSWSFNLDSLGISSCGRRCELLKRYNSRVFNRSLFLKFLLDPFTLHKELLKVFIVVVASFLDHFPHVKFLSWQIIDRVHLCTLDLLVFLSDLSCNFFLNTEVIDWVFKVRTFPIRAISRAFVSAFCRLIDCTVHSTLIFILVKGDLLIWAYLEGVGFVIVHFDVRVGKGALWT